MAAVLVVSGCENVVVGTLDPGSGRTFNVSPAVVDACELATVEQLENVEDFIQILTVGVRTGVPQLDALRGLLEECPLVGDDLSAAATCNSCSDAMVNQAYGPQIR